MIIIDIVKSSYTTNIQQSDSIHHNGDEYDTIGFTFDIEANCELHKTINRIFKECRKIEDSQEFSWISDNMRFEGMGYIKSIKGQSLYNGNKYVVKVSFRSNQYYTIKGKSYIRDYEISKII